MGCNPLACGKSLPARHQTLPQCVVRLGTPTGGLRPIGALTAQSHRSRLAKPRWRPPNWLFPPTWAVLYLTIAVSGWLVWWTSGSAGAALPLAIYLVQLVLNAAWSPIFVGMRRPDLAFVEIVILWCSIVATIATFQPLNAVAAWLLLPYLAWVTFAAALNFTIWRMNRGSVCSASAN